MWTLLMWVGVAFASSLAGSPGLVVAVIAVLVPAAGDLLRMSRARGIRPSAVVTTLGVAALVVVSVFDGGSAPRLYPLVIGLAVLALFVEQLARKQRADVTESLAYSVVPIALVGLPGAFLVSTRGMAGGRALVVVLIVFALSALGAATAVRLWRGDRPAREAAAAVGAALVVALAMSLVRQDLIGLAARAGLAVLVALAVQLARAVTVMLERTMPLAGSAGVRAISLRRIDGVVLAAPAFFYGFRLLVR
ncbi:MAG TPA: hypothetical protein VGB83_12770 [Actinomycetota bacterium]